MAPVMSEIGFSYFDTAIGRCGLAWGEAGLVSVQLPEGGDEAARRRLLRRFPAARELPPPAAVARLAERIAALLEGTPDDLQDVPLDMAALPDFDRRVYAVARRIRPGATSTYGALARELGDGEASRPELARPELAREVGQALGRNPFPLVVPCHRVLAAGGKVGGFSARGGIHLKRRLLAIESIHAEGPPTLFDHLPAAAPR